MRWSQQTIESEQTARLPGYRDEAVVRHFDAPEALDTNFYEVRAKSILNRVPEASRMPFRWTINPYRGCTHACSYCLRGDTRVLRSDGREVEIRNLAVGERIIGTEVSGRYRRFVETEVRDTWSSVKPVVRVDLSDGTQLFASADHRFLTARGWKHVIGDEQGPGRRPHLTTGSVMLGPGGSRPGPVHDREYRRGPAITRERALAGLAVKNPCRRTVEAIIPLGESARMYDITTGTGDFIANGVISHNCFARPTHTYLDFDAGRDFEREIVVKVNAPERLRVELARPSWQGEHIALGTNTDPYQWVEGRYRLMRGIWEAMIDARNPGSVLTKSPLLLRDLDLMTELNARADFSAALSIPTLDEKAWRATEPHTPNPRARLEAVAELNRAGIRTGVLVAPLMPGINDAPEQVAEILELASAAGAHYISGIALHLRGETRGVFMDWLAEHRSDLVGRYRELYRRGAYAPTAERRRLARLVQGPDLGPWERSGQTQSPAFPAQKPAPEPEQPRLFEVRERVKPAHPAGGT